MKKSRSWKNTSFCTASKSQCSKKVYNYPFLMGQKGVWDRFKKLDRNDSVAEVLKHGTLSVGFIGLAETLKALTGKHHGESEESWKLGLEIISHMREKMDEKSRETGLNFTLLATPAEGLSGRFVRIDQKKYGKIPGVTDREYYTNSFHVPVYYPISAYERFAEKRRFTRSRMRGISATRSLTAIRAKTSTHLKASCAA